jgi:mannosyl-oligosaccharide alpha-1,2-mannosidase
MNIRPAILPLTSWADTLWIMGLYDDFHNAVEAVNKIDFSTCALNDINVFETTIRYLGGFLSAYDLSDGKYPVLLQKATEMGEMLYKAFDTPNRMPITRWNFKDAINGASQVASDSTLVSEIGSLTLEFTRLSQATGDARFYDAVQRIMNVFDEQQNKTKLPGMWPVVVNAETGDMTNYHGFTIGGMADSLYEYLPKASTHSTFVGCRQNTTNRNSNTSSLAEPLNSIENCTRMLWSRFDETYSTAP